MSDTPNKDLNQEALPFFARFLEGQDSEEIEELSEEDMEAVAGGRQVVTRKYPSDSDEPHGSHGRLVTRKYPSDNDEPRGSQRRLVTRKYPSDSDEPQRGGRVVTYKYPSDNDEPRSR